MGVRLRLNPDDISALNLLREWRCKNELCGERHSGPSSHGAPWKWCPKCGASSRRINVVVQSQEEAAFVEKKLRASAAEITAKYRAV
jgi:hypothetical protein